MMRKALILLVLLAIPAMAQVSVAPLVNPHKQFFDATGKPLSGGKIYTYTAGTSTPKSTYVDSVGVTTNSNPIILDSGGYANVWLGPYTYKLVAKNSSDVTQWTVDGIKSLSNLTYDSNIVPDANDTRSIGQRVSGLISGFIGYFSHLYAKYFEGVRYANEFNATDIGAGINAAGGDCSWACKVVVPAGSYTTATSVVIPVMLGGAFELACDDAAISYTGSSYAINTNETTGSPFGSNISIHGCRITGTSSGLGGIHLLPTQGYYVWGNVVTGFSTGDGLVLEGAIKSHIYSNQFSSNSNNVHLFSTKCLSSTPFTCAPAQAGTTLPYAPNANVFTANILSNAVTRAMLIENSTNAALANVIIGNTFETNPTGLEIQGAVGTQVLGNYFENNSAHNLLLANAAQSTNINGNWITPYSNTTWYSIEITSATFTTIENNSEGGTASTCSVNMAVTANSVYMGKNNWFSTNPTCVLAASATPTGLQGFDGNNAWRAVGGFIGNGYQMGLNGGDSRILIQGTTAGGDIVDNPITTTLMTWTNAGLFNLKSLQVNGGATISNSNAVPQVGTPTLNQVACIKATGPPVVIGSCSGAVSGTSSCTCN